NARQNVLTAADNLAGAIRGISQSLSGASHQFDGQISSAVTQINGLAAEIQQYNVQRQQMPEPDPGADAQLHAALVSLSQLTSFSTVTQNDGTITVMLSGGSPLVIGNQVNRLSVSTGVDVPAANPASPPTDH